MKTKMIILLALALCNYLPADAYWESTASPMEPKTELEQLTVIMAKYGNNPENLSVMNYAVLQQDEEAFDLLVKYGATPGTRTLYCASKAGDFSMFKKIADMGVGLSTFTDLEWPIMNNAIYGHHNDIAVYLLENGKRLGFDYFSDKSYMLSICSEAGNDEMYNIIASMESSSD